MWWGSGDGGGVSVVRKSVWLLGVFPFALMAQVPKGFEELFVVKQMDIQLQINDEEILVLPGEMGLGKAKLNHSQDNRERLIRFLEQEFVEPKTAQNMSEALFSGVSDSIYCKGRRESCTLTDEGMSAVQYVVVEDLKTLRVFVPDDAMTQAQTQLRYIDEKKGDSALVMHHYVSAYDGRSSDGDLYYQNTATWGLFGGFLRSDVNVSTNENNEKDGHVYFDELAAHYVEGAHHLQFGYTSDNVPRVKNSTTLVEAGESVSVMALSSGTTRELEYKDDSNQPRIYFTISQAGRLMVSREDGSPVLERNVAAGQHYVSYDELPSGISTLLFEVRAGERVLYSQVHKIYNNGNSALEPGEWDYFVSTGALYAQQVVNDERFESRIEEYQYDAFAEARAVTQVNEDVQIGLGVINTTQDYFAKAAVGFKPSNELSADVLYGQFGDGSAYWQAGFFLYGLNVTGSQYIDKTENLDEMSFANYLFSYGSSRELTASYGHPIGIGQAYFSYSYLENEGLLSIIKNEEENQYSNGYQTFTAGYTTPAWYQSTLDVNLTYTDETLANGYTRDDWSVSASISLPLGTSGYTSFGVDVDEYGQTYRASMGNNYTLSPQAQLGVEIGASYDDSDLMANTSDYYGTLSGNYEDDNLRADAFFYADQDSHNVSATLRSSTIITSDSVYQTKESSDSYLLVENEGEQSGVSIDETQSDFLTVANLKGNGQNAGRLVLDRDAVIHPLEEYQEYQVTLDEAASDYHNRGDSATTGSSYPGTLLRLNVDMREIKSYISIFNDIEGNPVELVECHGPGCVDVEELSKGVFKFRISTGLPFELKTSAQRCLIPPPGQFDTQNLGENFCMPTFEESGELRLTQGESGQYYYYVGEFSDAQMIESYAATLDAPSLTLIPRQVGERIFLFARSERLLAKQEQKAIESLSQYALEETLTLPSLVSR